VEDVGKFFGHLVHFTVFCYILLTFGMVCGNLVYFSNFGILYEEKSGNPGSGAFRQRREGKNIDIYDVDGGCFCACSTTKTAQNQLTRLHEPSLYLYKSNM
jgi:hypothetical protein